MTAKHLLIMAAGTGGHIFPGIAIAQTMRQRGWQVSWLGTMHGMERDIVPRHDIELDAIDFKGMRGKGWRHTLSGFGKLLASFAKCRGIFMHRRPDVVLGMGGYVTVPGGLTSKLQGVPLVLMNADASLLLSNKVLTSFAKRVLFGFPGNLGRAAAKATVTGNPIRAEISGLPTPEQRYGERQGPLRILVVGGSLGAKVLNECVPAALALMPQENRPVVKHQSGKQHIDALKAAYARANVDAEIVDFIDDMADCYAQADLVICRAGAITVAELTAAGVASLLVPFVVSTTSHQSENARWLAHEQGAIHLPQSEMTPQSLAQTLQAMTREACLVIARAAYRQGRRNANEDIAAVLESVAEKQNIAAPVAL